MPTYAHALRHSLRDRATDLGRYLAELRTANWSAEARFRRAMDMLEWYAAAIIEQLEFDWETARDDQTRRERVQALLDLFTDKERLVDHRLARAGQLRVPRALSRLVEDGIAELGLPDIDAVVSVGPPGNFDTQIPDLWWLLNLDISLPKAYEGKAQRFASERRLSLISLPYIEGTRTLWQPIVVGHELGHLRLGRNDEAEASLHAASQLVTPDLVEERLDRFDIERLSEVVGDATINPVEDMRRVYRSWRDEVMCDLNVVRRYGPGGIAAVGEFLSIVQKSEEATASHPPLRLRLSMMLGYLQSLWGRDVDLGVADPWSDYVEELPASSEPWSATIEEILRETATTLEGRVSAWGDGAYAWPDRYGHVRYLSALLQRGQPGDVTAPIENDPVVAPEDIVNAAWDARATVGAAIPLDRLATKAIDTLAFVRAWQAADLEVNGAPRQSRPEERGETDDELLEERPCVGVLSAAQLRRLIRDERLVVTPLFHDAIGAAGLDVRLSSSFIVFRHSSTVAFSALDPLQDPRTMQERVEKSWGENFVLHPGELVLASTIEYLIVPDDLCAQVVTRSSYGRLGLITATAVQVQPGSIGCITLEMVNLSQTPIELTSGERIAQLVFLPVEMASEDPKPAKYQYQTGPEFSRVYEDPDVTILQTLRRRMRSGLA